MVPLLGSISGKTSISGMTKVKKILEISAFSKRNFKHLERVSADNYFLTQLQKDVGEFYQAKEWRLELIREGKAVISL